MKIFFEKPYNKLKLKHRLLQKSADSVWEQAALPIGNGSLGLSALGGVKQECITINCKSFWTGGPSPKRPNYCGGNICGTDENGKTRADYFAAARAAFADGNDSEGSRLCDKLVGETDGYGAYQCCGEIQMDFDPPRTAHRYISPRIGFGHGGFRNGNTLEKIGQDSDGNAHLFCKLSR